MFPCMVQVLQVCLFSVMLFGKYLRCLSECIECGFTLKRVRDMTRTYSKMHLTDKYLQHNSIVWLIWPNGWVFVYELSGCGFESSRSHSRSRVQSQSDFAPASSNEFLDIQITIECGFSLKRVLDITRTYSFFDVFVKF